MRLTKFSDYSLRILMYLASHPSDQQTTIAELAATYSISINHVRVVVHNLAKLGYITTTQGKGGGIKLAIAAHEISIADVIRHSETDFHLVDCLNPERHCSIHSVCQLQPILEDALEQFFQYLEQYSLEDITKNKKALLKQFSRKAT